jgi:hypothetical protein
MDTSNIADDGSKKNSTMDTSNIDPDDGSEKKSKRMRFPERLAAKRRQQEQLKKEKHALKKARADALKKAGADNNSSGGLPEDDPDDSDSGSEYEVFARDLYCRSLPKKDEKNDDLPKKDDASHN